MKSEVSRSFSRQTRDASEGDVRDCPGGGAEYFPAPFGDDVGEPLYGALGRAGDEPEDGRDGVRLRQGRFRAKRPAASLVAAEARAQHAERAVSGVGADSLPDALRLFVQEKSFGNDGVNFVLDEKGRVVVSTEREGVLAASADRDLRMASEPGLAKEAAAMTEGKSGVAPVSVDGREYNLAYAPLPSIGWSFGMMEKVASASASGMEIRRTGAAEAEHFVASLNRLFLENFLYMTALLCLIMAALFYFGRRTTRRIVEPILALDAGVQEIAKGNLDRKLDVKTGDEIERL